MKVCQVVETPEFKKLEKAVGFFEAIRDWKENNYTVREPEVVKNKLIEKIVREDNILASKFDDSPIVRFQDNKELYKKYNLVSKSGQLKVIPYKTTEQVNAAHKWIKTLNQSPSYSFKLTNGINGQKHIIITGKTTGQGIMFTTEVENPNFGVDNNVREKYFSTGNIQSMSSVLDAIAKRDIPLSKLAAHLQKYAKVNDVSLVLEPVSVFVQETGEIKKSKGYYDPINNIIKLAEYTSVYKSRNGFETLILHEALHALSYNALRRNNEYANAFRELYEESIKTLGAYDVENALGPYANYTIDEFFVALFTDSKFIKKLQEQKPINIKKFNNLFEEIMDYILGLLGIESKTSLYTQSFAVASEILNTEMGEAEVLEARDKERQEALEALDKLEAAEDDLISYFRPLANDKNQFSVLEDPLTLDEQETKKNRGMEIANKLALRLSARLGVNVNVVNRQEAAAILQAKGKEYNGEKGFFTSDAVYLVGDQITTEVVFHEFAHPILRAISQSNKELFDKLYNQLEETAEGQELIESVKQAYPELEVGSTLFKEEVMVFALSKKADNALRNVPETKGFFDWVKEFFYAIKQFFRKNVFPGKTVKVENLNANTTLDQLADMLANDDFKIEIESVSDKDAVSFSKEFRQEIIDHIKDLESEDAKKIIKEFYDGTKKVFNYLGKYNYKDLREVLKDPMGRSDVKEILSNLADFVEASGLEFENTEEALKYMNVQASNLINSLYKLEGSAKKILEHYKELAANPDVKDNLSKIYYYNNVIKEWMIFLDQAKRTLTNEIYDNKIEVNNPLVNLIDSISNTFAKTKPYSEKVLSEGVTDTLTDELMSMTENIDKMYKDLIEFYEKKGAPQKFIDRYKYEYEQVKLSPEKIKSLIKGELGDAHPLNFFFEGYMHNQDPVVFGFAKYVKNNYISMNAEIQENFVRFSNEIEPLLEKAGYKSNSERLTGVHRDLAFSDRKAVDKDGNVISYSTFLSPYKDFEYDRGLIQKKIREARANFESKNTDEAKKELADAEHELDVFEFTYMNQEKTPEFYKRFDLLSDDIGKEANRRMKAILTEIQGYQSNLNSIEQQMENNEIMDELWRQYKLLGALVNLDGTPKTGFEKDVAERINEYKSATRGLYEWKPRLGLFENKYLDYLQSLEDQGIRRGSKEFRRLKKEFLDKNTVVKYNDAFYSETGRIFAEMAELAADDTNQKELTELFEKRNSLISSYKDENGHPTGTLMTEDVLKKVKDIDQKIRDVFEKAVVKLKISQGDWNAFIYYEERIQEFMDSGDPDPTGTYGLSIDQWKDYSNIKARLKKAGKTKEEADKILKKAKLLKDLTNIQRKSPTDDYIDEVNSRLNDAAKEHMKKRIGTNQFSRTDINYLTNETFIKEVAALDPEFKKWFDDNHIAKTFKRKGKDVTVYTPSAAWTYREPKDAKYYEKTEIKDEDGNIIETLNVVPKLSYWYRAIKPEYKTVKKTILDCIREGIGIENATVDMKGRWLPRMNNVDTKYINQDYFKLRNTEPDKHNLLIALIKNHLEYQEKYVSLESRLNLEIPRYEIENFELGISTRVKEGKSALSTWAKKVKNLFAPAADDFEEGLNPEQKQIINKMDLFDEDNVNVPITGTYNLEEKMTSKDIMRGMMRYMQAGVKQKTLIDMLPMAKALQALVNDPDNNPDRVVDGVKQFSKQKLLTNTLFHSNTPKSSSIRAQAVNAFIEREFEGKNQAGYTKDMTTINKVVNRMFSWSSKAYFAFNIPSALKNSLGLRFQSMIEAAAGNSFNMKDYTAGSIWASKVTFEYNAQNYKMGDKSLNLQIVQLMDPDQGRFQKEVARGTGTTRSMMSDAANLEFMTSVRKMTELNANLSILGAMLKNTVIERTMPDGSVSKITYDQAWEVVDGVIQLKSGIDSGWAKDGKKFKSFVSKVHGVINNMNGAYAQFDQPNAQRFLLYRFFMFMKNYFIPMFMNRWGYKWDSKRKLFMPRYDANLDTMTKGYYIETLSFLGQTLKNLGKNIPYMNDQQKIALKKTLMEVGLLSLIGTVVVGMFFGYDSDDDDRYEKLRKKSGPLPIFGAGDAENPFHLNGWVSNHLLSLALAVRQENESWLPVPYMGMDDYNGMLKAEGAALKTTVSSYVRIAESLVDLAKGDPSAYYKRDVGPYSWQQEGGLKIVNHAAKMFGVTGKSTEPIINIKATESFETFKK